MLHSSAQHSRHRTEYSPKNLNWNLDSIEVVEEGKISRREAIVSDAMSQQEAEKECARIRRSIVSSNLSVIISDRDSQGMQRLVLIDQDIAKSSSWSREEIEIACNDRISRCSALVMCGDAHSLQMRLASLQQAGVKAFLEQQSSGKFALCVVEHKDLHSLYEKSSVQLAQSSVSATRAEDLRSAPIEKEIIAKEKKSWFSKQNIFSKLAVGLKRCSFATDSLCQSARQACVLLEDASISFVTKVSEVVESRISLLSSAFSRATKQVCVQLKDAVASSFSKVSEAMPTGLKLKFALSTTSALLLTTTTDSQQSQTSNEGLQLQNNAPVSMVRQAKVQEFETKNESAGKNQRSQRISSTMNPLGTTLVASTLLAVSSDAASNPKADSARWTEQDVSELAKLLSANKLGMFHCQGCIDAKIETFSSEEELNNFYSKARALVDKEFAQNQAKLEQYQDMVYELIKQSKAFKGSKAAPVATQTTPVAANNVEKVPDVVTNEGATCSMLETLNPGMTGVQQDKLIKAEKDRFKFTLTGGPYLVFGEQKSGFNLYGQAGIRYDFSPNIDLAQSYFEAAVSLRPNMNKNDAGPDINPLSAKLVWKSSPTIEWEAGLSTSIGNPAYEVDPFAESVTLLPCGCTGSADSQEVAVSRMGVFDNALWERSMFGVGMRMNISDDTKISLAGGVSYNDVSRDNFEPVARLKVNQRIAKKAQAALTVSASSQQVTVDAGLVVKPNKDLTISASVSATRGKRNSTSGHVMVRKARLFGKPQLTGHVAGSIKVDHDRKDQSKWQVLGGVTYKPKPQSKWDVTVGGYVSGPIGSRSSEPTDKGVVAALTFNF